MRKIDEAMIHCFDEGKDLKRQNTRIEHIDDSSVQPRINVYLHDNLIAKILEDVVVISHCGYITATTMARLNTVLNYFTEAGVHMSYGSCMCSMPTNNVKGAVKVWYKLDESSSVLFRVPRRDYGNRPISRPVYQRRRFPPLTDPNQVQPTPEY